MSKKREKPYWVHICRHFTNGADALNNKCCSAGIRYDSVTANPDRPGSAFRMACHAPNEEHGLKVLAETGPAGTCEHFSELTEEEIEKQNEESEEAFQAAIKRMKLVMPIVAAMKMQHEGESVTVVKACPVCGGKLHLRHSGYNGHVHGKCETDGCVSWME